MSYQTIPVPQLGARLRTARRARQMTQEALETLTGLPRNHIADYERGKHQPSLGSFLCLVVALGVSADVLLGLQEP